MAAILLAACSQDELAEQGNTLPDGEYPLQIGSVSMSVESSEEPWTRVSESTDGKSSVWETGDEFYVKFEGSDEVGTYRITDAATGAVEAVTPIYWKSTQPANIIAWYAKPQLYANNWMDLRDQENGLAYVLRATADNASYDTQVSLQFKHQLAKVRVVTKGTVNVRSISIRYPFSCFVNEGIVTPDGPPQFLDLYKTHYEGIGTCWEINLPVGNDNIEVCRVIPIENSAIMKNARLTPPVTLEAGKVHTITITANREGTQTIDLSNSDYEINDDGTYYFSGTASHAIRVTGGSPNIYLEDAEISVSGGNAIDITGGSPTIYLDGATVSVGDGNAINITNNATPTIYVVGENNTITSSNGAGIYVAENATVTITGSNRSDVLTVTGNEGSSGIGGYVIDDRSFQSANSGNINIKNITLYAYSSSLSHLGTVSPGIGSTGSATCQSITIDNAAVYAYGCSSTSTSAPAIGNGIDYVGNTASATPTVTISNSSEVHAHRGESGGRSFADYIGRAGVYTSYSDVKASVDATSVVYKYTGDGNTPDQ